MNPIEFPPQEKEKAWGCQWNSPLCKEESTHFHAAYGELCPKHAVEIIKIHPEDKVVRIKC